MITSESAFVVCGYHGIDTALTRIPQFLLTDASNRTNNPTFVTMKKKLKCILVREAAVRQGVSQWIF